eukprot:Hpha_TRINITY_DN16191_c6_g6::TRINITY_DN16191_c6_g6_i1::g.4970::m.4970
MTAVISTTISETQDARRMNRLNAHGLAGIHRLFSRLDLDGSGDITSSELRILWRIMFPDLSADILTREVDVVFASIDIDNNNRISWEEMVAYLDSDSGTRPLEVSELLEDDDEEEMLEHPETFREWLWALFEHSASAQYTHRALRWWANCVQVVVTITILLSVAIMMIESLPALVKCEPEGCDPKDCSCTSGDAVTGILEAICIALFTIEFVCRTSSTPDMHKYSLSGWTWVDILSILPFYFTVLGIIPGDSGAESLLVLRVVKIARLSRILRMLRVGKQFKSIQIMIVALGRARMAMVMMCVLMLMTIVFYSSMMYFVERRDAVFDPVPSFGYPRGKWIRHPTSKWFKDAGEPLFFQSIPDTMWWGLATVTTVGYGDVYPVTPEGKAIASLTMVTGILVVSYPITILTNAFATVNEEFREDESRKRRKEEFKLRLYAAADCEAAALRKDPMLENCGIFGTNQQPVRPSTIPRKGSGGAVSSQRRIKGKSIREGWVGSELGRGGSMSGVSLPSRPDDEMADVLARLTRLEEQQTAFQEEVLRRLEVLGAGALTEQGSSVHDDSNGACLEINLDHQPPHPPPPPPR